MQRFVVAALAALCIFADVHAASPLLRCVDVNGHVTFTQHRCPEGTKLTNVTVADPAVERRRDTSRTWVEEAARIRKVTKREETSVQIVAPPGSDQRDRQRQRCAEAREAVSKLREEIRFPTFEQLRRWQDYESEACKGL